MSRRRIALSIVAARATPPGTGPEETAGAEATAEGAAGARAEAAIARATARSKFCGRVSGRFEIKTACDVADTKGEAGAASAIAARTELMLSCSGALEGAMPLGRNDGLKFAKAGSAIARRSMGGPSNVEGLTLGRKLASVGSAMSIRLVSSAGSAA